MLEILSLELKGMISIEDLVENIIVALKDVQEGAVLKLWAEVCSYMETNTDVLYSWSGKKTNDEDEEEDDPVKEVSANLDTTNGIDLDLTGLDKCSTPEDAMLKLSEAFNTASGKWAISFPEDFNVSECFILPEIELTPSGATTQADALTALCTQIIDGLKHATPEMAGSHGDYSGTGTFTSIN